ncbi:MAG: hypothetical protein ACLU37_10630 [Collinsella sp.]
MNLREKYGEWGLILGATEGVGKAFCEKIAAGGETSSWSAVARRS